MSSFVVARRWWEISSFVFMGVTAFPVPSFADVAAKVVEFRGQVSILESGKSVSPAPNLEIPEGALIRTGDGASIKLLLSDQSVIDVGAASKVLVRKVNLQTKQVDLALDEGKVKAVVTKRKETESGRFTIRTKAATMGVRGTQLLAVHSARADGRMRSSFFCLSGAIWVDDAKGGRLGELRQNQFISVAAQEGPKGVLLPAAAPAKVQEIPKAMERKLEDKGFLERSVADDPAMEAKGVGDSPRPDRGNPGGTNGLPIAPPKPPSMVNTSAGKSATEAPPATTTSGGTNIPPREPPK